MTYLDAAHQILTAAGQPLHYAEITRRALEQNLIQPTGLTPDATMASRLYISTQKDGSPFVRVGRGMFDLAKPRLSGIDHQVQQINQRTREQLRELLLKVPAKRFESLVMELLLAMGFDENTLQVTPYGGDGGIDVVGVYRAAGLTEVIAAVQAKRWKSNVSAPTVTQLRGSLQVHQQGIIITTSDFSKGARQEAVAPNKTRIALINGDQLVDMLIEYGIGVVERTLQVNALDDEWWAEIANGEPDPAAATSTADIPAVEPEQVPTPTSAAPAMTSDTTTSDKPEGIVLFGQRLPVKSWRGILLAVCEVLARREGERFATVAVSLHGRKRQYIASSPEGLHTPQQIPGTELFVETNMSARSVMQVVRMMLEGLGHPANALTVLGKNHED
ncbi:MAG: restriction endonuclease [Caldilineaceae bacterium]|nr:restriction endonuclease [Caldilineaceae bacterium]